MRTLTLIFAISSVACVGPVSEPAVEAAGAEGVGDQSAEAKSVETGEQLPCTYWPQQGELADLHSGHLASGHLDVEHPPELNVFSDCAVRIEGKLQIEERHLKALSYDEHGLGVMLVGGDWHYVRADGTAAAVMTWDNGADYFIEGLARTVVEGKIAYLDRSLAIVLPPTYDWGWPFADGAALVCRGCRPERAPGDEHTSIVGGEWGYIDSAGREMVAVRYSRDGARTARAKLSR